MKANYGTVYFTVYLKKIDLMLVIRFLTPVKVNK
jgi:hypothetical protein